MSTPSPNIEHVRVDKPSSFAEAAVCLADAAEKLSAAAEAISAAARMFDSMSPTSMPVPGENGLAETNEQLPGQGSSPNHASGTHQYPKLTDTKSTAEAQSAPVPPHPPSVNLSQEEDVPKADSVSGRELGSETTGSFRILVDQEEDVLLIFLSVLKLHKKTICYMPFGLAIILSFKQLVESATKTTIYTLRKSTTKFLNSVFTEFARQEAAVLLVPETVSPSNRLRTFPGLCVVHLGWPSNAIRYRRQIDLHQAHTNILIAFTEDGDLYPGGSEILSGTTSWPARMKIAGEVRLLFDEQMSQIPNNKKENIYVEWITWHGLQGPRHVKTWDATTLVHRANLYLLDVLQYRSLDTDNATAELQVSLPRVSPQFVSHHKLESAVENGVLHVQSSSLGGSDFAQMSNASPHGTVSLNENPNSDHPTPTLTQSVRNEPPANQAKHSLANLDNIPWTPRSTNSTEDNHSALNELFHITNDTLSPAPTFKPAPGHKYIAIVEEFDAIPLICFLANVHGRLVCFLDGDLALNNYRTLLDHIVEHQIYYPSIPKDDNATEEAALSFMSCSTPSILLLYLSTKKPPYVKMNCPHTYIIMTTAQRNSRLEHGSIEFDSHPDSEVLITQGEGSVLASLRNETKAVLASNEKLVKAMYRSRAFCLAKVPRHVMSAEKLAQNANIFAARILLRGSLDDGNNTFKPIADRPSVKAKFIRKFELESAVELGLLTPE
ncbi:hypothetical protein FRC09_006792 [Ceratobasidium sp. 395]|nr:hypothetical protein FRC09_006792 [Ceratobasidium sp. 395]